MVAFARLRSHTDQRVPPSVVGLVGKDQTEVLRSLRASVEADKTELDAEVRDLKNRVRDMTDKERMQVDQVNRCAPVIES
jgi:protein HOOK3